MAAIFESRGKQFTYDLAKDQESDVIREIREARQTEQFYNALLNCRHDIELLTAHHLGLGKGQSCLVLGQQEWMCGRFNICIPVVIYGVNGKALRKVLMRCPMAHMLAEDAFPGTMDEKMRCEVATYAYIQDNCPEIPIADLIGFGFPDGRKFTHSAYRPFYQRVFRRLWRALCSLLQWPAASNYLQHPNGCFLGSGYILLEYVDSGVGSMLSDTWEEHKHDIARRKNLFRGLSRIGLSLSRKSWPKIGSLTFYNDAAIGLTNRPLSCSVIILENNSARRVIGRNQTFNSVESYICDLFSCHENRFLEQPNASNDDGDCRAQMAVSSIMRATAHHFFKPSLRNGPFRLGFTDDHQSQFLVDKNWNITKVIDLEWVCSMPAQMFGTPHWLTGKGVDQIHHEALVEYSRIRQEYMTIFKEEERRWEPGVNISQSMETDWDDGTYWFAQSLTSVNAMYNLFEQHLRPLYISSILSKKFDSIMSNFFMQGTDELVKRKVADKKRYDDDLRELFTA